MVTITISAMKPQWATPGSTITVSGTLRNTSGEQDSHLTVQLLGSGVPVTSVAQLVLNAGQAYSPATNVLPGAVWQTGAQLAPGATTTWSIQVPARALGMTTFGVYPLAAQAQSVVRHAAGDHDYHLPALRAGQEGTLRQLPAGSGQDLVAVAADRRAAADRAVAEELHRTASQRAGAEPGQRAAQPASAGRAHLSSITWVVDPALLANVRALAACGPAQPRWAKTASAWLAELKAATAGRPLSVTPYGDPNVGRTDRRRPWR